MDDVPPILERNSAKGRVVIGAFEVDLAEGVVRGKRRMLRLQEQPFQILLALLERPGELVTREELRRRLWPEDTFVEFDGSLNHAVQKLRDAFGDSAQAPRYIETIPRRGYRIVATVERPRNLAKEDASSPVGKDEAAASGRLDWLRRRHVKAALAAGLLVLAVTAITVFSAYQWRRDHIESVAVLPLADFSENAGQGYLADGLTEELTTDLSHIRSLRVISRTSSMRYRGTKRSLPEIGRELGVDAVIEGSVQRAGNQVRVSVQLVRTASERHLWAQNYQSDLTDVLSLRRRLASEIAHQIGTTLTPEEVAQLGARYDPVPEAHEDVLLGWSFFRKGTRDGFVKSVEYLERATQKDPNYALAYAELAESYAMVDFTADERGVNLQKAQAASRKALELDPDLPEALIRVADLKMYWDWDWSQCDGGFRRGVELNPGSADVRGHYATCLEILGRHDEALREMEEVMRLDPVSPLNLFFHARALRRAGQSERAIQEYRKILDLEPDRADVHVALAAIYADLHRDSEAVDMYLKATVAFGEGPEKVEGLRRAFASGGFPAFKAEWNSQDRARALDRLNILEKKAETERVPPIAFAAVYAALGDRDRAFEWLDKAYEQRSPRLVWLKSSQLWDPLRSDPRYQALLRRMKLPE